MVREFDARVVRPCIKPLQQNTEGMNIGSHAVVHEVEACTCR